jgi:hypothetical protein
MRAASRARPVGATEPAVNSATAVSIRTASRDCAHREKLLEISCRTTKRDWRQPYSGPTRPAVSALEAG